MAIQRKIVSQPPFFHSLWLLVLRSVVASRSGWTSNSQFGSPKLFQPQKVDGPTFGTNRNRQEKSCQMYICIFIYMTINILIYVQIQVVLDPNAKNIVLAGLRMTRCSNHSQTRGKTNWQTPSQPCKETFPKKKLLQSTNVLMLQRNAAIWDICQYWWYIPLFFLIVFDILENNGMLILQGKNHFSHVNKALLEDCIFSFCRDHYILPTQTSRNETWNSRKINPNICSVWFPPFLGVRYIITPCFGVSYSRPKFFGDP